MEWLKAVIVYGIIGLLIVLSVVAVDIAIKRGLFFKNPQLAPTLCKAA